MVLDGLQELLGSHLPAHDAVAGLGRGPPLGLAVCLEARPLAAAAPLLKRFSERAATVPLVMDRACEGNEIFRLVRKLGMVPIMQPMANRSIKWDFDRETYNWPNQIKRLFH